MLKIAQALAIVQLAALLAGCDGLFANRGERLLDDYLDRLERITELERQPAGIPPPPRYPTRRERHWPAPAHTLDLGDYWNLRGCTELFALLNNRNSILGRVQQPLERLAYEQSFVLLAPACLAHLATVDKDSTELQAALDAKQAWLPRAAWNASFDSNAFANHLSLSSQPIAPGDTAPAAAAGAALETWLDAAARLNAGEALNLSALQRAERQLENGRYGGRLLHSLHRLTETLEQGTALLRQRAELRPLCAGGRITDRARVYRNVLTNIFIGRVQPYAAQVRRETEHWRGLLGRLYRSTTIEPHPGVAAWAAQVLETDHPDGIWQRYLHATRAHALAWRDILEPCGLAPAA